MILYLDDTWMISHLGVELGILASWHLGMEQSNILRSHLFLINNLLHGARWQTVNPEVIQRHY